MPASRAQLHDRGSEVSDPFQFDDAQYLDVVNNERQYPLWPVFADAPAGWNVVFRSFGSAELS
ncbi:MbtH family NRPS accessory protein [Streptomyces sp. NPDC002134]|uniref:MbtH family NRPS accessory protein n=1 Tax=Streptomyces sp. NPDC002134 TaxID=3364632 RepID=UPI0036A0E1DB